MLFLPVVDDSLFSSFFVSRMNFGAPMIRRLLVKNENHNNKYDVYRLKKFYA